MEERTHYIYKHTRLDTNEVFYIGIGTFRKGRGGYKTKRERAYNKTQRSIFWKNIVEKTNYTVDIIFESYSRKEIELKEIELIKFYGRKDLGTGTLVNLTDGGEGVVNKKYTKEEKEKLRQSLLKRYEDKPMSEYTKNKISETLKGNGVSPKNLERRKTILTLLENNIPKYQISKQLKCSKDIVKEVALNNNFTYDVYTVMREDGLKFIDQLRAANYIKGSKKVISEVLNTKYTYKGFRWFKIYEYIKKDNISNES